MSYTVGQKVIIPGIIKQTMSEGRVSVAIGGGEITVQESLCIADVPPIVPPPVADEPIAAPVVPVEAQPPSEAPAPAQEPAPRKPLIIPRVSRAQPKKPVAKKKK